MSKLRYLIDWRRLPARTAILGKALKNPPHGPQIIQIEHTRRCNLKCVMCAHGASCPPESIPDLTLDEFKACVDGPHALGHLKAVHIQGLGEPFLHKDFPAMVRHANRLGLDTATISNMTVMNGRLAEEIITGGLNLLSVSLDSPDSPYMAALRRGASFDVLERMIANLRLIRRKQAEMHSATPEIIVYAIVMRDTLPQLPALKALLQDLGIRVLNLENLLASGVSSEALLPNGARVIDQPLGLLSPAALEQAVAAMAALNDDTFTVQLPDVFEGHPRTGRPQEGIYTCLDLWNQPAIGANGIVTPCCFTVGGTSLVMGDIRRQSFRDIWHGKAYNQLRRAHLLGSAPEICRKCPHYSRLVRPWKDCEAAPQSNRYQAFFLDHL